jgi:hypothetical protein
MPPDPAAALVAHRDDCIRCLTGFHCEEKARLIAAWRRSLRPGKDSSGEGEQ